MLFTETNVSKEFNLKKHLMYITSPHIQEEKEFVSPLIRNLQFFQPPQAGHQNFLTPHLSTTAGLKMTNPLETTNRPSKSNRSYQVPAQTQHQKPKCSFFHL